MISVSLQQMHCKLFNLATCVDVTVNGLRKMGISSLAEVVTSLDELFKVKNS